MGNKNCTVHESGLITSMGRPARIVRHPKTAQPQQSEIHAPLGEKAGYLPTGSHYEPGAHEQAASGRRGRVVSTNLTATDRGRALARAASHHAERPVLSPDMRRALDVDAVPAQRPLPHEEIARRLAHEVTRPVVLERVVQDELTLDGPQKPGLLSKISIADGDDVVTGEAVSAAEVGAPTGAAPSAISGGLVVRPSVPADAAAKIAALDRLAGEISTTSTAAPDVNVIVAAFQTTKIAGIGDLVFSAAAIVDMGPAELRDFYRRFVVDRLERVLSPELQIVFAARVAGLIASEDFISRALALPFTKPAKFIVAPDTTQVSVKPDFALTGLTRTQVLHLLMKLSEAVKPGPLDPNLVFDVATKLKELGFRNFEQTLLLYVSHLPDKSEAGLRDGLSDFIRARLERVLSPVLSERFVIMLHSHDYAAFWQASKDATDEAIWAVDAAPTAGGMGGGKGHRGREEQKAEDENPA